jgi:5,10-methylenetetrahydromethanopterin reductase
MYAGCCRTESMTHRKPAFWTTLGFSRPEVIGTRAKRIEADGWDGLSVSDTQSFAPDAYVALTIAALATEHIRIGTAVTNPITRHAAVTSNAIASVDLISGGRAVLGIGRGDSALANVGVSPPTIEQLGNYVRVVRAYLDGSSVSFDSISDWTQLSAGRTAAGIPPPNSRLAWLTRDRIKVPLDLAASGPRVMQLAATHADWVTLNIGADPARLRWAIDLVRTSRNAAGRTQEGFSIGAYLAIVPLDDIYTARKLAAGTVASRAHMATLRGRPVVPASPAEREVFEALARRYNMGAHGQRTEHTSALTDDFVDSYAVLGPVSRCIERLEELVELGIDRFALSMGSVDLSPSDADRIYRVTVERVIPRMGR